MSSCIIAHSTMTDRTYNLLAAEVKGFECSECGKTFKAKFNLNRHMLTHGKSAYSCSLCNKSFSRNDLLTKHGKKCKPKSMESVRCVHCHKTFATVSTLKRHKTVCKGKTILTLEPERI